MIDTEYINIYPHAEIDQWEEIEIFGCKGDNEMCDDGEEPEFYKVVTNHHQGPIIWLADCNTLSQATAFKNLLDALIINFKPLND